MNIREDLGAVVWVYGSRTVHCGMLDAKAALFATTRLFVPRQAESG